jgi:hypothetical protein
MRNGTPGFRVKRAFENARNEWMAKFAALPEVDGEANGPFGMRQAIRRVLSRCEGWSVGGTDVARCMAGAWRTRFAAPADDGSWVNDHLAAGPF